MKLPEPVTVAIVFATGEEIPGYTVEQMLAWGKACAAAEREECAKFIESTDLSSLPAQTMRFYALLLKEIVATIRARGNK
jgi:hypothetical protein